MMDILVRDPLDNICILFFLVVASLSIMCSLLMYVWRLWIAHCVR